MGYNWCSAVLLHFINDPGGGGCHCHLESCWGLGNHHWGNAETGKRLLSSFVDSRHGWGRRCQTILKTKMKKCTYQRWHIGIDMLWGWLSYHFQARLRLGTSLSLSEARAGDDRRVVGQARARSGRCRLVIAQSLGSSLTSLGKVGSRGDCVLVASEKAGARESSLSGKAGVGGLLSSSSNGMSGWGHYRRCQEWG